MSFGSIKDPFMRQWLALLYQKYGEQIGKVVSRRLRLYGLDSSIADDLVQEVFMTALEKSDELISHPTPLRWLYKTADNMLKNYTRRQRTKSKHTAFSIDDENAPELRDTAAERAIDAVHDNQLNYDELLNTLRTRVSIADYTLFTQVYQEKLSKQELSVYYGLSASALCMRIGRMRERMIKVIKEML